MKFLNFGSLNLDIVYSVDHCVRPGETTASEKVEYFCGGKGLNQSIALSRAGAGVYHAGQTGTDGKILLDALKNNGINTQFVKTTDAPSGHAVIQVDKSGQNSIIIFGGANAMIEKADIVSCLSHFSAGDVMFIQNETNAVRDMIEEAYARGITVVFNPSPFKSDIMTLPLEKIGWFVVNETEAMEITGETETDKIFASFKSRYPGAKVLLTLGERGSYCMSGEMTYYQPIFKVKAVDTTAAGDTYLGYFFALLDRFGEQKAMQYAAAASSVAVSRNGASASIPAFDEIEEYINNIN